MDLSSILIVLFVQITIVISQDPTKTNVAGSKAYAKLFRERRKESKDLLKIIANEGAYERKYKLLEGAYNKLMIILEQTQGILQESKYDPMVSRDEF